MQTEHYLVESQPWVQLHRPGDNKHRPAIVFRLPRRGYNFH